MYNCWSANMVWQHFGRFGVQIANATCSVAVATRGSSVINYKTEV